MVTRPDQWTAEAELALAFVNTVERTRAGVRDDFAHPDGVEAWLQGTGLVHGSGDVPNRSSVDARLVREEALRLRTALRALFDARSTGAPPPPAVLHTVNRVLEHAPRVSELAIAAEEPQLRHVFVGAGPFSLLAPVALAGARLVAEVDPTRLRPCAAADCPTWFIDTSKGGRRRWCSMARCGNRAKATRHRRSRTRQG